MRNGENTLDKDISLPLIIVNPRSASGATSAKWARTAAILREHFGPFGVEFTKGPGDAESIASAAAAEGRGLIIACGGDGTINEVANGIIRSEKDAELGILPSGTGGDLRRSLGIPVGDREAARTLLTGVTRRIDAGLVRFVGLDGEATDRYYLNVASVGLAADVIKRVKSNSAFDWLPVGTIRGQANFAVSVLQEIFDLETETLRIRIDDGEERRLKSIAFCVANSRYFGGGMMIAPDAKLDDGRLDIVNVGVISTARIIFNGLSLYRGTHGSLEEVHTAVASTVDVASDNPDREIFIETDGELPGKLPARFEVVPGAIRVRVPHAS